MVTAVRLHSSPDFVDGALQPVDLVVGDGGVAEHLPHAVQPALHLVKLALVGARRAALLDVARLVTQPLGPLCGGRGTGRGQYS